MLSVPDSYIVYIKWSTNRIRTNVWVFIKNYLHRFFHICTFPHFFIKNNWRVFSPHYKSFTDGGSGLTRWQKACSKSLNCSFSKTGSQQPWQPPWDGNNSPSTTAILMELQRWHLLHKIWVAESHLGTEFQKHLEVMSTKAFFVTQEINQDSLFSSLSIQQSHHD